MLVGPSTLQIFVDMIDCTKCGGHITVTGIQRDGHGFVLHANAKCDECEQNFEIDPQGALWDEG